MSLYQDVIMAGFGGHGVMLIGNLLAYAGMEAGYNVTYSPVYGPEMRGGTANCTVVLSDDDIGSPIIKSPVGLIAMNQPSLVKFQPTVQDGCVEVVNSSLIDTEMGEADRLKVLPVPANELADRIGTTKMANMVALGAFVQATKCLELDAVKTALSKVISAHYSHLIPKNADALQAGADHAVSLGF